jgi:hypothetical protein
MFVLARLETWKNAALNDQVKDAVAVRLLFTQPGSNFDSSLDECLVAGRVLDRFHIIPAYLGI